MGDFLPFVLSGVSLVLAGWAILTHGTRLAGAGLALWAAATAYLTLVGRTVGDGGSLHLDPFTYWHTLGFFQNMLLFIPLGLLLGCRGAAWGAGLLIGLLLSVGIETVQYITTLGIADISDVAANVLGTVLGLWCYHKRLSCAGCAADDTTTDN